MGSPKDEKGRKSDETQREVELASGYWIGRCELTRGQYQALMGFDDTSLVITSPNMPVVGLNWEEAMNVCRVLTAREQVRGTVPMDWEYTLPTEAQWEYACRAGTTTAYSFGDDARFLRDYARFYGSGDGTNGRLYPVGSKKPNPWGIRDMHGNAFEWCLNDAYGLRNPSRAYRGGSFNHNGPDLRSARRFEGEIAMRTETLGLRLALVPAGPLVKREQRAAKRVGNLRANMQPLAEMLDDPEAELKSLRQSRRIVAYYARLDQNWAAAEEQLEALISMQDGIIASGRRGKIPPGGEDNRYTSGDWMDLAAVYLKTGNLDAYGKMSRRLVTKTKEGHSWTDYERTPKTYFLQPQPPVREAQVAAKMARVSVDKVSGRRLPKWYALSCGMAEYRLGKFEEASRRLQFSAQSSFRICRVMARSFHAMAAHRLGDAEYASWLLATASEEMMTSDDPAINWCDEVFAEFALKEARELIGGQ
jgi:hypothetical protein